VLVQLVQKETQDSDDGPMKDRTPAAIDPAVIESVPKFPTTRVDTLLPFLVSVYHFCHDDGSPVRDVVESLRRLVADQRSVTPDRPAKPSTTPFEATPRKAKSSSPYSASYTHEMVDRRLFWELDRQFGLSCPGICASSIGSSPQSTTRRSPRHFPPIHSRMPSSLGSISTIRNVANGGRRGS